MPISNPEYASELNELAQLCTDSAETYRRAGQTVRSARFAAFCKRRAEERELMAGQFRIRVGDLNRTAEEGGTARGAAEKLLGEAKSLLSGDESAVLSELVRVEGHLKSRFEAFLDTGVPAGADNVFVEHYGAMARAYRELCALTSGKSRNQQS